MCAPVTLSHQATKQHFSTQRLEIERCMDGGPLTDDGSPPLRIVPGKDFARPHDSPIPDPNALQEIIICVCKGFAESTTTTASPDGFGRGLLSGRCQ